MEIIIAILVFFLASYFMYKTFKAKKNGVCSCDSCSAKCPHYNNENIKECKGLSFIENPKKK